jgi:hypothetical protein
MSGHFPLSVALGATAARRLFGKAMAIGISGQHRLPEPITGIASGWMRARLPSRAARGLDLPKRKEKDKG